MPCMRSRHSTSDAQCMFTISVSKEQREKMNTLKLKILYDTKKIEKLEDKVDWNIAYERRDTFIMSGKMIPPGGRDENCTLLTCKLIKDKLNHVLSPNDIWWWLAMLKTLKRAGSRQWSYRRKVQQDLHCTSFGRQKAQPSAQLP